jgi:hypothetical protein
LPDFFNKIGPERTLGVHRSNPLPDAMRLLWTLPVGPMQQLIVCCTGELKIT